MWDSLNWITAGDVGRLAHRHGLCCTFYPGGFRGALDRLGTDPAFARRQEGPVVALLRSLDRVGVVRLLSRLPPAWMTPMTFELVKPAPAAHDIHG